MPAYDDAKGALTFKVVYYGAAQSGKTTNLMALHDQLRSQLKGELLTLETQGDRTLFFDLLPVGFRSATGLLVKVKLFTVPGQVQHDATRKAVLSRADGVVFVADSQMVQEENNAAAFQNLAENCARVGLDFEALPLVVQFNKRDLRDVLPEEEVRGRWEEAPWPLVFATALKGEGVRETFELLLQQLYRRYGEELDLANRHGVTEAAFVAALMGQGGQSLP